MNISTRVGEWIGTQRNIKWQTENKNLSEFLQNQIPKLISEFNAKYSRFDKNSLISQINTNRELLNIDIETKDIITQVINYQNISDGYFDPFVWSDLEQLGYDNNYSFIQKTDQSEYISSIQKSSINLIWNNIYISGNQKIEFGWIGKWYLINKIKNIIELQWITNFVINGWWDIYIRDISGLFGKIGIQNPLDQSQIIWYANFSQWSIAASGWLYRTWWKWLHHLIDPHTHLPVNDIRKSIHIYCENIVLADVASTTLSVTPLWIINQYAKVFGVEYMIVYEDMKADMSANFPFESL